MKYKKAQIGSTITWFVGFLVVIFILFLFITMSFSSVLIQRVAEGKPEIDIGGNTEFHKSEQQRRLFVLFEEEFEKKTSYDIIKEITLTLERKKELSNRETKIVSLKKYLKDKNKIITLHKNCFNFFIIDSEDRKKSGGRGGWGYEPIYYFSSSEDDQFEKIQRFDYSKGIFQKMSYSFFFPEKTFALIKYIPTKCPEKADNE